MARKGKKKSWNKRKGEEERGAGEDEGKVKDQRRERRGVGGISEKDDVERKAQEKAVKEKNKEDKGGCEG